MVRTRYAPSPTGYMHAGNLRTGLYAYLTAKALGGKFIVRIEDTDQTRFVEGAVDVIFDALRIAGVKHDEGPDVGGDFGPYVQSQRKTGYLDYAKELIAKGKAYYCFCQKDDEDDGSGNAIKKYDRRCLKLTPEEIEKNLQEGKPYVIRQLIPEGRTSFKDEVFGEISVDNKELEDQILIKTDGFPTYNFANVIDDHLMGITHVHRDARYLSSAPKYHILYNDLGWTPPAYVHLPLVTNENGEVYRKRTGAPSIQMMVDQGYLPEAIVNYIILLGWAPPDNREFFTLDECCTFFNLKGLSKSPSALDPKKLNWMNAEYIKRMDDGKFLTLALPIVKTAVKRCGIDLNKAALMCKTRIELLNQIPEMLDFIDELPDYSAKLYENKKMKTTKENSRGFLELCLNRLRDSGDFSNSGVYNALVETAAENGLKNSQLLWPLRTALSGKQSTPGGASELCELLGKDESLRRIQIGIDMLG